MAKLIKNAVRREKEMAEWIWLNYFNNYLFEHGTISEKEYRKMVEKIATRRSSKRKNRRKKKGIQTNARIQISNSR